MERWLPSSCRLSAATSRAGMADELWVANAGRIPYLEAVELQTRLRERRQAGEIPDSLLLLEHPPVYTKGRRTERADLPMGDEWYMTEGVEAEIRDGLTGVWVGERKIGSIGLHVSKGITMHGFAVNVDNDLQPFEWIVPCGIDGVRMTSVYLATGRTGGMDCFRKRVAWRFGEAFGLRQRIVTLDRLLGVDAPLESVSA